MALKKYGALIGALTDCETRLNYYGKIILLRILLTCCVLRP
jgi:hypothetical protein